MGWSTTAPAIPSGSSWTGSTSISQIVRNHIKLDCTISIARLTGSNVAVKCHFTIRWGSYGDYYVATLYLKEGGSAADTSFTTPSTVYSSGATMDVYWTGEKAASASVSITVGINNDSSSQQTKTLTAPALITYTITYNGNGSTGGSTSSQTKTNGTNLTLRQNGFTKTGYAFVHWNTKADDSGVTYAAGGTYTTNGAATLYAIWKVANIPVYINDNETVKQISKAYINDNGTIKECTVYINDNGTIKQIV